MQRSTDGTRSFKVLLLGALRCGKSELLNRAVEDRYEGQYKQTLGAVRGDALAPRCRT